MESVAGLPGASTLISVNAVDYIIIALCFVFVLGIGFLARHEPAGAGRSPHEAGLVGRVGIARL
jgi:hypothetical protein